MKKYILYTFMSLLLFSCKEDEIDTYDVGAKRQVYFTRISRMYTQASGTIILKREYTDSMLMSFVEAKDNVMSLPGEFPITVMGPLSDKPVKLKFKINEELTTGVEGEDFEINLDTIYIQPNETKATLRFKALRTPKLLKKSACLAIDLIETEEYDVMEKYNNTDIWNDFTKVLSGKTFRIFYSDIMTQPDYWNTVNGTKYFAKWTLPKFKLLNSIMDWSYGDWANGVAGTTGSKISLGVMGYAAFQMQTYLQAQADSGNPVMDEDGTYMQLGTQYTVDYSDYI